MPKLTELYVIKVPSWWCETASMMTDKQLQSYREEIERFNNGEDWKDVLQTIDDRAVAVVFSVAVHEILNQIKNQEPKRLRNSREYSEWRAAVYERYNYTCQNCGKVGTGINAHHIKPFSKYPELRFEVSNGVTLCKECHKLAHKRRV